ncbi:hypothetical protein OIU78_017174 [Salix suchowensis]|nr:hypothetical protein OIU78_017174 [Salix suchowensis]
MTLQPHICHGDIHPFISCHIATLLVVSSIAQVSTLFTNTPIITGKRQLSNFSFFFSQEKNKLMNQWNNSTLEKKDPI